MRTKMIRSKKNDTKKHAVVTGTLVAQYKDDVGLTSDEFDMMERTFRHEVEETGTLRPVEPAECHRVDDNTVEVRCRVEYGPVKGAYESDLLRSIPENVAGHALLEGAVFNVTRQEKTPDELAAIITDMEAKIEDVTLSLAARKNLSKAVARLREQVPSVSEAR
jgi:hypothetical protein